MQRNHLETEDIHWPNMAFLCGAQKAGTTYLASLLSEHPEISVSRPKETNFFVRRKFAQGFSWYRNCFESPAQVFLDCSPSYTMARLDGDDNEENAEDIYSGIPQRISRVFPQSRFIYIVRDPVDRAYSAYWHSVRSGLETRSFADAIQGDNYYLRVSNYFEQIKKYLKFFKKDQIKVVFFEELKSNNQSIVADCFEHLGVKEHRTDMSLGSRHETFKIKQPAEKLYHWYAKSGLSAPYWLKRLGKRYLTQSVPPITPEAQRYLREHFETPNNSLRSLLGHEIPFWSS